MSAAWGTGNARKPKLTPGNAHTPEWVCRRALFKTKQQFKWTQTTTTTMGWNLNHRLSPVLPSLSHLLLVLFTFTCWRVLAVPLIQLILIRGGAPCSVLGWVLPTPPPRLTVPIFGVFLFSKIWCQANSPDSTQLRWSLFWLLLLLISVNWMLHKHYACPLETLVSVRHGSDRELHQRAREVVGWTWAEISPNKKAKPLIRPFRMVPHLGWRLRTFLQSP